MSAGPPPGRPAEHRPIAPNPRDYRFPAIHQTDPPARRARPVMHTVGRRSEPRPGRWKVPGIWQTVGLGLPHKNPPARTPTVPRSLLGNASGIRTALPENIRPPSGRRVQLSTTRPRHATAWTTISAFLQPSLAQHEQTSHCRGHSASADVGPTFTSILTMPCHPVRGRPRVPSSGVGSVSTHPMTRYDVVVWCGMVTGHLH